MVDSGTSAHERQQRNRDRITGAGSPRPFLGDDHIPAVHVENYGLQEADWGVVQQADPSGKAPHDSFNFRRHGSTEFVNLVGKDAVETAQIGVSPDRVAQIHADPASASDPRFPGRELPRALRTPLQPAPILVQGTHRVANELGNKGALFTEMRVLDADKREGMPPAIRRATAQRVQHGAQRAVTGDPTAQYTTRRNYSAKEAEYKARMGLPED